MSRNNPTSEFKRLEKLQKTSGVYERMMIEKKQIRDELDEFRANRDKSKKSLLQKLAEKI